MNYTIAQAMPLFLLALLLFWQKRKLNLLIMVHIVVVLVLYARGVALYPSDWNVLPADYNKMLFELIFATTTDSIFCFSLIWLYQWWYTGRRRSEINGE